MNKNIIKMFLVAISFLAILIIFPSIANAADYTSSAEPAYDSQKDIFAANGTPITIEERDGKTYAVWSKGEQVVSSTTTIIGGYYNPATESNSTIDLAKTSVTMNSGNVAYIVGGNVVDKDYAKYNKIHVGTINVDINGGKILEVSAVAVANNKANVALASSYYSKIKEFYYADNVKMNIKNANVSKRVYVLSSYTYAADVEININNSNIENGYHSLAVGTNGKVGNYVVNINNSSVDSIHSGFRTMVDNMTVNVTGNSVIGDVYAGSYYGKGERYDDTKGWTGWNIGDIDYGQVGSMTFDFGENVTYNNVYAGFQFEDKAKFAEKFAGNDALNNVAKGIANSENAKVVINTYTAPKVTNSELTSIIGDYKGENVTVNVKSSISDSSVNIPEGEEALSEIVDKENFLSIINTSIENNEEVLEALKEGREVSKVTVKVEALTPSAELVDKMKEAINENTTIAKYLDISILLEDKDGKKIANLTNLNETIEFEVKLPDNLPTVEEGFTRNYYVLREHNGKIDKLDATLSKDGKSILFATDKFSVYALSYEDVKKSDETGNNNNVNNNNENTTNTETNIENPKTGDSILVYATIALVATVGMVFVIRKVRK